MAIKKTRAEKMEEAVEAGNVKKVLKLTGKNMLDAQARRPGSFISPLFGIKNISEVLKNRPPSSKPPKEEDKPEADNDGPGKGPPNNQPKNPAITPRASNSWADIVGSHFSDRNAKYYKEGGLVRGGGKAVKGRGRGKMV